MPDQFIRLRGVAVHNLKDVDLDLPREKLIVFCGVSGSGKTSLALDTLYAEGQRRYIESFSAYTRQFLQRLEKPAAERIEGIPPAIAVTHKNQSKSSRSTVGTVTETIDYLRLLYARIGTVICHSCGRTVRRDSPESVADQLLMLPDGTRYVISFPLAISSEQEAKDVAHQLHEDGFVRAILAGQTVPLHDATWNTLRFEDDAIRELFVVVDRLSVGSTKTERIRDSLETSFQKGNGRIAIFAEDSNGQPHFESRKPAGEQVMVDDRPWRTLRFSTQLTCEHCGLRYPPQEPRLFSFSSPLGACTSCEGFGNIIDIDMDRVVPDQNKSLREGAIAPWNTPAYAHELEELLELADDYDVPVDVPFHELSSEHLRLLREGVPERQFGGLDGFFAWLERRKYKMHIRVFLSRWRSYRLCQTCHGARLRKEALATRLGDKDIAELSRMRVGSALSHLRQLSLSSWQRQICRTILDQLETRLQYLEDVGLGYLTLDRTLRTLSGGEAQRVALSSALGSNLVNMLYVLDEPTMGLHRSDVTRLQSSINAIRDRGNTVVLVEHDETIIGAADHVIEVGPGAGASGGRIVFEGSPAELMTSETSRTGDYMAGRRGVVVPERRRKPDHGWIRLDGASGNNLKSVRVEFPLGLLCLVTGVSGSGKSTLIEDTLFPALCMRKRKEAAKPFPFGDIFGDGQIDDVVLIDQSPIGRSPRSNPITYIKGFDAVRAVFADTLEARTRNYGAGHFSFNVDGGRCNHCHGDGFVEVDMQFLANVFMKCSHCDGKRYRREILDITHRGRNIADVLEMTVRQAFNFFRGQTKVQVKLKRLMDVGLDYLRLGQPANTLSSGEAQRLKLAGYLNSAKRARTLFLLDEPTTGLHFSDVVQLLDCFDALISSGHSLIVVEHNLQLIKAADYIVDLGPGAADEGGTVVAHGTPEQVAQCKESVTGRYLQEALKTNDQRQAGLTECVESVE